MQQVLRLLDFSAASAVQCSVHSDVRQKSRMVGVRQPASGGGSADVKFSYSALRMAEAQAAAPVQSAFLSCRDERVTAEAALMDQYTQVPPRRCRA